MTVLNIGTSTIRQLDGLYSLNDLHIASGSEAKHKPALFLRLDQTQALIQEIKGTETYPLKTITGRNGGTYACRELVIAYAAWISAAFHLKVIRVFLAQVDAAPAQLATEGISGPFEDPAYRQEAREFASVFFEACRSAVEAAGVPMPVLPTLNEKIIDGILAGLLMKSRFLVSFDHQMRIQLSYVHQNATVISAEARAVASAKLNEACRHLGLTSIALNH